MARRMTEESLLQSLPQAHAEVARRILDALPQAQRPEALRIISSLCSRYGERARDSLLYLERIVSSGRFRPSYLGTCGLMAERAGDNADGALREFGRLLESDKFNRHVHETVRLAVIRAGSDSAEALMSLHFLLSNPAFTAASLNTALPDRFLRFLDSAIRSGGDESYMAIRAMGSLFCNPSFTPSEMTLRRASSFGQVIRAVREGSGTNRLEALQSLGVLLSNSAIRPQEVDADRARGLAALVNTAVEYTRPFLAAPASDSSGARAAARGIRNSVANTIGIAEPSSEPRQYSIEGTMRAFNLILGDRSFSLDMLPEGGLLHDYFNSAQGALPDAIERFRSLLRNSRRSPEALPFMRRLMGVVDPSQAAYILDGILSNPALAPLLADRAFQAQLIRILQPLALATHLESPASTAANADEAPVRTDFAGVTALRAIVSDPRCTAAFFGRAVSFIASLGEDGDTGAFYLRSMMMNPGFRPGDLDDAAFRDLAALVRSSHGALHYNHRLIGMVLANPAFEPRMLEPGTGVFSMVLRSSGQQRLDYSVVLFNEILSRHPVSGTMEEIIRRLAVETQPAPGTARLPSEDFATALRNLGGVLASADFQESCLPAILSMVRSARLLAPAALRLYAALSDNPAFRTQLPSGEFALRASRLAARLWRGTASEPGLASLEAIFRDHAFRPSMMEDIEAAARLAGPAAGRVFQYMQRASMAEGLDIGSVLSREHRSFFASVARALTAAGGDQQSIHEAFSAMLQANPSSLQPLIGSTGRLVHAIETLSRGGGRNGSLAVRCAIPLFAHLILPEGDYERLGRWMDSYLSGLDRGQVPRAVESLPEMFSSIGAGPGLIGILLNEPGRFARGTALARRLIGPGFISPEVSLNFAWAIGEIGAERTEALYRAFGMRYFARYSTSMLEQLHRNIGRPADPSRRSLLVMFPHHDYNGAFYREGLNLDGLMDRFNVVIYERADERGFYSAAADFGRRYGRTGSLIIGGHGTPESIRLGENNEAGMLDLTDQDEMAALRGILGPDPSVILVSCSTGRSASGIGALISRVLRAHLYAPAAPGNVAEYSVDRRGRLSATYSVRRGEFATGAPVRR
jgi:hypothetical protein